MKELTLKELSQQTDVIDLNKFAFQLHYPIFQQARGKNSRAIEIRSEMHTAVKLLGKVLNEDGLKKKADLEKLCQKKIDAVHLNFTELDIVTYDEVSVGQKYRADQFIYQVKAIVESRPARGKHVKGGAMWYRLDVDRIAGILIPQPQEAPAKKEENGNIK